MGKVHPLSDNNSTKLYGYISSFSPVLPKSYCNIKGENWFKTVVLHITRHTNIFIRSIKISIIKIIMLVFTVIIENESKKENKKRSLKGRQKVEVI